MASVLVRTQGTQGTTGLSAEEKRVVELFGSWTGRYTLPGLLLLNVDVPEDQGRRRVDGVVFTPGGLVILEIKGLLQRQTGTLHCPPNGAWTVGDQPALIQTQARANPKHQLEANIYATEYALERRSVEPGTIAGMVVIVPEGRKDLKIAGNGKLDRSMSVVLSDQKELRKAFAQLTKRRGAWSADGVISACAALDMTGSTPSREELLTEGFAPAKAPGTVGEALTLRTPRPAHATLPVTEPPPMEPPPMDPAASEAAEERPYVDGTYFDEAIADTPTPPHGIPLPSRPLPMESTAEFPRARVTPRVEEEFEFEQEEPRRTSLVPRWLPVATVLVIGVAVAIFLIELMRSLFH